VNSDLLQAVDSGDVGVLVLLDLSAAFDTVDHKILLERLSVSCGLYGAVLSWFVSYLQGRTQQVRFNGMESTSSEVVCGVPQGSVLGPILFTLYISDLAPLIRRHSLNPHLYADDTQAYGQCNPDETEQLQVLVSVCLVEITVWMSSNRLQLNTSKTEVMWVASSRRQHLLPHKPFQVVHSEVQPISSVRDLGIYLDSDTSMNTHITKTVGICFGTLRALRSVRHSVPRPVLKTLVSALVLSRLDYGNANLHGVSSSQLDRYQAVLHSAARLIFGARGSGPHNPIA